MSLSGCRRIKRRLSWVESGGCERLGGRRGGLPRAEVGAESHACEGFWPDETKDLRACRSTVIGRECVWSFMLRTCLVEVVSEAGVDRRRAVRRRAWFHHTLGSSRVNGSYLWTATPV